jgi:predicted NAD/FAD-binding protein
MRIAVVGAGISGLVAARELSRSAEVHLFDSAPRAGGHALTVDVDEAGRRFPVDVGFIVYNDRNYPVFSKLLGELGVESAPSSMGFSVSDRESGIEYSGEGLLSLFARPGNALDPRFWSMLRDLRRFWREGTRALDRPGNESLAAFCDEAGLSESFRHLFLRPMGGAIWSMPRRDVDSFPARALLRFFHQHGLLSFGGRPQWKTIAGGSRRYVEAILARLPATLRLGSAVERVERFGDRVELRVGGEVERFDRVVLACHADTTLSLLADPSDAEREILAALRYRAQQIDLHRDRSLLPRRKRAWAAWNVANEGSGAEGIGVTYLMNRLQPLPTSTPWCVTLNRRAAIDPAAIERSLEFAHPQFDAAAVAAQGRWGEISGLRRTHFAGAGWRYGFHEDGAWSGLRAAQQLLGAGEGR